jgi:hypothetical protein
VNASFVVAQLGVRAESSQTHIALRPVFAIVDGALQGFLFLLSSFSLILLTVLRISHSTFKRKVRSSVQCVRPPYPPR